ncbi:MAG TPA: IclR family transcriptional regulator [Candidatus Binatia bacterium]
MVRREKSNYVIQSVSHALDVLEQFNGNVDEIGVTELSKRLKLHKNNVFRLLATLEARGYIEQNKVSENYRLGLKCLQLGQTFIHQMGLLLQARATLEELTQSANESAFVAIRKGAGIVPLDFVEPVRPVRVVSFLGSVLPSHCTAVGKVYLAFESDGGVSLGDLDPLKRYNEKTITDTRGLAQQVKETGEIGYAIDDGEFINEISSIAVPVRDYTRSLVGALAIVGPSDRLTLEKLRNDISPLILDAGRDLSRRLGYAG